METNHTITLKLPFAHKLLAMIERAGKKYVAVQITEDCPQQYTPYVTYRVYDGGVCEHGHYWREESEMHRDLIERSTPSVEAFYRR